MIDPNVFNIVFSVTWFINLLILIIAVIQCRLLSRVIMDLQWFFEHHGHDDRMIHMQQTTSDV